MIGCMSLHQNIFVRFLSMLSLNFFKIKILRRFQWILPTLLTAEFSVDSYNLFFMVGDIMAICLGN